MASTGLQTSHQLSRTSFLASPPTSFRSRLVLQQGLRAQQHGAAQKLLHVSCSRSEPGAGDQSTAATGSPVDLAQQLARTLWGKGLPPSLLVDTVREGWTQAWRIMLGQLAPQGSRGEFRRTPSQFRSRIAPGTRFPPEKGRYHLYAALSCPWAHRTLIVHSLKGLSEAVPVSIAMPSNSGLWAFPTAVSGVGSADMLKPTPDQANGCQTLREVYKLRPGGYDGRSTVPMLWDTKEREVVNNESADIIEILNEAFNDFADNPSLELNPVESREDMAAWNALVYEDINNGVYKCGFATSQAAYDAALEDLFAALEKVEAHLATNRFLCSSSSPTPERPTLADIRLFTTLIRFDAAYATLFKCSRKRIEDYPNLSGYLRDLYQLPGVASTCDLSAVIAAYYGTLFPLNPGGIVPPPPFSLSPQALARPPGRETVGTEGARSRPEEVVQV